LWKALHKAGSISVKDWLTMIDLTLTIWLLLLPHN
jgi:hypothetical protein